MASTTKGSCVKTRLALICGVTMIAVLAGACETDNGPSKPDPVGTAKKPVELTFMAYGPDEEVKAMQSSIDAYNRDNPTVEVTLDAVSDEDDVIDRLESKSPPDVFMLSQRDLAQVSELELNQPIDELLDSRGVPFGDFYKRDAVQAFSVDNHLQCMPYGVSPMVMYYNTNLIDWTTMKDRGLDAASSHSRWSFNQFAEAAKFASNRKGVKGVYIDPSLEGLMPFVLSGGGQVFDDMREPTTTTLSEDSSKEALTRSMDVLNSDQVKLTPRQLRKKSALERFKTGKLGMIAGYRNLVPELRMTPSLDFDVMPMPILDDETTVGDVSGICMSANPASYSDAADFIVNAISAKSVAKVAEAGYLVPSHNEVAESDAFLQPDKLPAHPEVFNRSVRDIVMPPLLPSWKALEDAVHDPIYHLFYDRILDIDAVTESIDEASRTVLSPEDQQSGQPSGSASPGGDESDSPSTAEE
ncbi:MAG: extracellular solute-binding protein [Nocardioides sp.]|nr:extracellular solute-binding protein [Nocardioides sp.]